MNMSKFAVGDGKGVFIFYLNGIGDHRMYRRPIESVEDDEFSLYTFSSESEADVFAKEVNEAYGYKDGRYKPVEIEIDAYEQG